MTGVRPRSGRRKATLRVKFRHARSAWTGGYYLWRLIFTSNEHTTVDALRASRNSTRRVILTRVETLLQTEEPSLERTEKKAKQLLPDLSGFTTTIRDARSASTVVCLLEANWVKFYKICVDRPSADHAREFYKITQKPRSSLIKNPNSLSTARTKLLS